MKETGIIMSGDHPTKILDGTKTMTRRTWGLEKVNQSPNDWECKGAPYGLWQFDNKITGERISLACPYGGIGDRLWVRETYHLYHRLGTQANVKYLSGDLVTWVHMPKECKTPKIGTHPSIHMPRWASRITLEITEVRVERLQDMPSLDARKEGIRGLPNLKMFSAISYADLLEKYYDDITDDMVRYLAPFIKLWDSLNAKRGYGWNLNKWIWVIGW